MAVAFNLVVFRRRRGLRQTFLPMPFYYPSWLAPQARTTASTRPRTMYLIIVAPTLSYDNDGVYYFTSGLPT